MSDHLREYQPPAVDAVFAEWEKGIEATILHMATGTGKTVCLAEIVRRAQPRRALVLAHRRELVHQAQNKIEKFSGLDAEVEMAGERASLNLFSQCHAVVSSVQSQTPGRRSHPTSFDLLVVDECHHVRLGNKSYMDVINHYRQNPNLKILGLTATLEPGCLDVFKSVAFSYPILTAINDGYLVNIEQQMVSVSGLDYSHIRTTAGDLNGADLAAVVESESICQGMIMGTLEVMFGVDQHSLAELPIEKWAEYLFTDGTPRKNLVFTVSVAQAKMMSDIFNRVKPGISAWVCGDVNLVSELRRKEIGKEFHEGKDLLIVCNCGVYSEGYDNPTIQMVTMARPTKSKTLFTQQIGRGTRVLDGIINGIGDAAARLAAIAASAKKILTVLDFVGNCGRHKLISSADILGDGFTEAVRERARKNAEKSEKPQNMIDLLRKSEQEIADEKAERERQEAARKARLVAKAPYHLHSVNPFDATDVQPGHTTMSRDGKTFSEAQSAILRKAGYDPARFTYGQGQGIIGKIMSKPSEGQSKLLKKHGYTDAELSGVDRRGAHKLIDAIAANGWRRPPSNT